MNRYFVIFLCFILFLPPINSLPEPMLVLPNTVVMFDEAHFPVYTVNSSNPTSYTSGSEGMYRDFANFLEADGFKVATLDYGNSITQNTFIGVKVFVIVCSQGTKQYDENIYSDAEINAIVDFVRNGGGLFIIGDHSNFSLELKRITNKFSATFSNILVHDQTNYIQSSLAGADNDVFIFFENETIKEHEINKNVHRIEMYRTNIIDKMPPEAIKLITTDSDAYYYVDDYGNPSNSSGKPVLLGRVPVSIAIPEGGVAGKGRVVLTSDTNTFETHEDRDYDGVYDLYDSDNEIYGLNIIRWLANVPPYHAVKLYSLEDESFGKDTIIHEERPGNKSKFKIGIKNIGNLDDKYNLSVKNTTWNVTLEYNEVSLLNGEEKSFYITVDVPTYAKKNEEFFIIANSIQNSSSFSKLKIVIELIFKKGIRAYCTDNKHYTYPSVETNYSIFVENVGEIDEYINFELSAPIGWVAKINSSGFFLRIGMKEEVILSVKPPASIIGGTEGKTWVKAYSTRDINVSDIVETITVVIQKFDFEINITPRMQYIAPNELGNYTISVSNLGNGDDIISFKLGKLKEGWFCDILSKTLFLPYNGSRSTKMVVSPSIKLPAYEELEITVFATSMKNENISRYAIANGIVKPFWNFSISVSPLERQVLPGNLAEYELTIKNEGNIGDEIKLGYQLKGDATIKLEKSKIFLQPNIAEKYKIEIFVNETAIANTEIYVKILGKMVNATIEREITILAKVLQFHKIDAYAVPEKKESMPGEKLSFSISITNIGNGEEMVRLYSLEPKLWDVKFEKEEMSIPYNGTVNARVFVQSPFDTRAGNYNISIRIIDSAGNEYNLKIFVNIIRIYAFEICFAEKEKKLRKGAKDSYYLIISNFGNDDDKIELKLNFEDKWFSFDTEYVELKYKGTKELMIEVNVPKDAKVGKYEFLVSGKSEGGIEQNITGYLVVVEEPSLTLPCLTYIIIIIVCCVVGCIIYFRKYRKIKGIFDMKR
ncbi:MAG: hypothetical protein AB1779_00120 [Candidatus Thermoplasmatota archaeon]